MNVYIIQHVPFERAGCIHDWLSYRKCTIHVIEMYDSPVFPAIENVDLLVIMGGPMGVHDSDEYPWLAAEFDFVLSAINAGVKTIGICLGAQLIAYVLGATISVGKNKEIGWYPLEKQDDHVLTKRFPKKLAVFHWHGETFEIPKGAIHLFKSEACQNQGFIYKNHVVGLQFHLEMTTDGIRALLQNCGHELVEDDWIQSEAEILSNTQFIDATNQGMFVLLDRLVEDN